MILARQIAVKKLLEAVNLVDSRRGSLAGTLRATLRAPFAVRKRSAAAKFVQAHRHRLRQVEAHENSFKVGEEKMAALMNMNHPLAKTPGGTVTVEQLAGEKIIVPSRKAHVDAIAKWFRKVHANPEIVCEMDNYLDAAAMAGRGVGISIFPRTAYVSNYALISKEIEGDDKIVDYLFVWRKGHQLSTLEETFIDFIKSKYVH